MEQFKQQTKQVMEELIAASHLRVGDIVVVGCSTSEVIGKKIGTMGSEEAAKTIFEEIWTLLKEHGVFLAAQCCEHLNRALIVEESCTNQYHLEPVNVVPHPKGGGAFATQAYAHFEHPVAVEHIRAHAGLDIGGTLIGMHLREVAVPLRVSVTHIGQAPLILARTRPKFIGGIRAHYDETLL